MDKIARGFEFGGKNMQDRGMKHQNRTAEEFFVYAYVFLAVNQYANEAWSVILLQLISLNPSSPGLGTALCSHTYRHASVNTTHTYAGLFKKY